MAGLGCCGVELSWSGVSGSRTVGASVIVAQGLSAVVVRPRLVAVVAAEDRGASPSFWCVVQASA